MSASIASPEPRKELETVEIHGVLSNERRQMTLEILRETGDSISARELSERIAEIETGEQPPPRNIRQSAYVSLLQTHLPKLDDLDIVDYDSASKTVRLSSSADQVSTYMSDDPGSGTRRYGLVLSIVGLGIVVAANLGVPVLSPTLALDLVGLLLLVLAGVEGHRTGVADGALDRFRD